VKKILRLSSEIVNKGDKMNYWWVNHGKNYKNEIRTGHIKAPIQGKIFWENVGNVKKGDYIISYAEKHIRDIGVATSDPTKKEIDGDNCWYVEVSWTTLNIPFKTLSIWKETEHLFSMCQNAPLAWNGKGCQGYLYDITKEIFDLYCKYINKCCKTDISKYLSNGNSAISTSVNNETEKSELVNNDGGKIKFIPDKNTFRERLLNSHKANWTIIYNDGKTKSGIWDASNITEESNIVGNIHSGYLRDWKKKGIKKAIFEVKDIEEIGHETIRDENTKSINKSKSAIIIKKSLPESSYDIPLPTKEQPYEIVQRAMDKITEINQDCKNHKRDPIFKQKVHELSRVIEKPCTSKEQFINFTLNLYIMIYETTRERKSNNTKGKSFYDYKLPYEFIRDDRQTKHFMDIVGTFRHHYAHLEPEYKIQINKIPYEDVLFELLGNRNEPKSREDFQKLQIGVLKQFEDSMKKLLEIVESELNRP